MFEQFNENLFVVSLALDAKEWNTLGEIAEQLGLTHEQALVYLISYYQPVL